MTSIPCDIVLRPSPTLRQLTIQTSNELSSYDTYFALKEGEYFPHISLYMLQLDLESIEEVKKVLERISHYLAPFPLVAKEFHQEAGYIDVEYERNEIIDGLQQSILTDVNPLRDGLRKKDEVWLQTATGIELENLKKYGYRSIGTKFAPHITLTRFKDENTKPSIINPLHEFSGQFDSIGLFEMGDNGTCIRRIFEIYLG